MKRRRDDPYYVRSALATLVFYGSLVAVVSALGYVLRGYALAALGALLLYLYRGPLFGLSRWPERVDVERLFEHEHEHVGRAELGERR